jgi:hypothetical protein
MSARIPASNGGVRQKEGGNEKTGGDLNQLNILLHDEVQLIDWGESRSLGPFVKLRLNDPELLKTFRGMDTATAKKTGHILNLTLSEGDIIAKPEESTGVYGNEARELRLSGFFRRPAVWREIGADAAYQEWTRGQKCIICGDQDWNESTGEGRCIYAHVRRASGMAIKPEYSGVPMCKKHHDLQHQSGEGAAFSVYLKVTDPAPGAFSTARAREWFEQKALLNVEEWAWRAVKTELGFDTWKQVPPYRLRVWAHDRELAAHLPQAYRQNASG